MVNTRSDFNSYYASAMNYTKSANNITDFSVPTKPRDLMISIHSEDGHYDCSIPLHMYDIPKVYGHILLSMPDIRFVLDPNCNNPSMDLVDDGHYDLEMNTWYYVVTSRKPKF